MSARPSGIILAGGASRRFGEPKALADWNGRPMISAVRAALAGRVSEVLVVAKDLEPLRFLEGPGTRLVADRWAARHALGGVVSGLLEAASEYSFVCACDMPLLSPEVVTGLWRRRGAWAAVVPFWKGVPQVLCSLLRRDVSEVFARRIGEGCLGVRDAFGALSTLRVDSADVDPTGSSFFDVDTREDLRAAREARC